jgi:hypothetical protein
MDRTIPGLLGIHFSMSVIGCLHQESPFIEVQSLTVPLPRVKIRAQNVVLGFAAVLCFIEAFSAPRESDPGPTLTAVMGILLVRRAIIITTQSTAPVCKSYRDDGFRLALLPDWDPSAPRVQSHDS